MIISKTLKVYDFGGMIVFEDTTVGFLGSAPKGSVRILPFQNPDVGFVFKDLRSGEVIAQIKDFAQVQNEAGGAWGATFADTLYNLCLLLECQCSTTGGGADIGGWIFITRKADFPAAVGGVITLEDEKTYVITADIDLTGDRLVAGQNTTIIGGSSENCFLRSTGLVGTALLSSAYSLPLRNLSFTADIALNLNAGAVPNTQALDWFGVNFVNCATVGTIANYNNFIMTDSALLNSQGMTFDGTISTIGFAQCLFDCTTAGTAIIIPSTATITRRFRIIYSAFVVLGGETGINFDALATVPTEGYILDTVSFGGGGTYLAGVNHTSNKALFTNCTGITNTAVNGQLYMQANATATTVLATTTFYKVAGTTTASPDNSKFSHSNNRLTCDAIVSRKYLIQFNLSFTSGANNICEFGFYDSQISGIRTPSRTLATANAAGRAENVSSFCVLTMKSGDYLEIHCANNSAVTNITVESLNFIITEIK